MIIVHFSIKCILPVRSLLLMHVIAHKKYVLHIKKFCRPFSDVAVADPERVSSQYVRRAKPPLVRFPALANGFCKVEVVEQPLGSVGSEAVSNCRWVRRQGITDWHRRPPQNKLFVFFQNEDFSKKTPNLPMTPFFQRYGVFWKTITFFWSKIISLSCFFVFFKSSKSCWTWKNPKKFLKGKNKGKTKKTVISVKNH